MAPESVEVLLAARKSTSAARNWIKAKHEDQPRTRTSAMRCEFKDAYTDAPCRHRHFNMLYKLGHVARRSSSSRTSTG